MSSAEPVVGDTVVGGPVVGGTVDGAAASGVVPAAAPGVAWPAARRRPGAFRRLYAGELRLVFGRRRNLALLAVLAIVPIGIGVAVRLSTPRAGEGPAFLGQITGNGLFLLFTSLIVSIPFFLPLVVGAVAGDSIAGEAGTGTLRYLLTVPVTRGRLLAAKALGVGTYTAAAVIVVGAVGLIVGAALFGVGDVTLLSGDTVGVGRGLLRAAAVTGYVVVALLGLAAGGLFVSTLTENAIAAMAATIGIAVFSELLDAVPQLHAISGGLLTHYWLGFGELLRSAPDGGALVHGTLVHLAYTAVFVSLAWARFTTKDVTS